MLGQSAPIQGCMVARVARIRGNRLQVVTDELPENLSCVALPRLCRPTHYTGQSGQDWQTGLLFQSAPTPSGPGESPRQFELFHPSSRFRLTPFVLRYALRAPSAYPSRAIR